MKLQRLLITLPLILIFGLSGCVSREERAAKLLLAEAQSAYGAGEYDRSLTLLDSLHRTYPGAVEARKLALHLQQLSRSDAAREDSMRMEELAEEGIALLDSLRQHFVLVEYPEMPDENILRYKGYDPSAVAPQSDFLDAYLRADGQICLVAGTSASEKQEVTYLRLTETAGGTYVLSDTIPYDGALHYRFRTGGITHERLTFSREASDRLADFVRNTPQEAKIRASFGPKGKVFTLDAQAREAISAVGLFYRTYVGIKNAEGERDAATLRAAYFGEKAALSNR